MRMPVQFVLAFLYEWLDRNNLGSLFDRYEAIPVKLYPISASALKYSLKLK